MSLKVKVKVGHITNLSEARYCAGMGVDLLGFPVGEDGLQPGQYRQLIEWVAGPEFVLEVHRSASDIGYITGNYPGHYIEIGTEQLGWLSDEGLNFIVALTADEWAKHGHDLSSRKNIKYIEILDWRKEMIDSSIPVLLNTNDFGSVLSLNMGIALNGSDEEKPGIKDYSGVANVLEALEE